MKKFIIVLLLAISFNVTKVYAIESADVQKQYEINIQTYIEDGMPYIEPVGDRYVLDRSSENFPSYYDARDCHEVSSIKNQNYNNKAYGTCWAFSSTAMSENNILKQKIMENADFSEMHLIYFAYHRVTDPYGGTKGDYNEAVSRDYRQLGGNANLAISSYASWMGPVDESDFTYDNIEKSMLEADDELAYGKNVAHMQNSYWVSMTDADIVKKMIMDYGAAQVSFRWNESYYNYENASYYKNTTANTGISHAVTIIGWDDDYSFENFKKKPERDGAWLVKNSWGDKWGDNGYFWISYEDKNIVNSAAYIYDYEKSDNYQYNYQYDGTADLGHTGTYGEGEGWMSNVFTSDGEKTLKAVSFYLLSPNMHYSIQIYKNISNDSNPTSGTPVFEVSQNGNRDLCGYYTVKLDKEVVLKKGEKFSIVICLKRPQGGNVFIPMETTEDVGYSVTAFSESGQSFTSADGLNWNDRKNSGNVRIKAFLDDTHTNDCVQNISVSQENTGCIKISWKQDKIYDGYTIYRKYYGESEFAELSDVSGELNEYSDFSVEQGREYHYTVRGYIISGNEKFYGRKNYSRYICTSIAPVNPVKVTRNNKGILVTWNKNSNVSGYLIYRSTSQNGRYDIVYNANKKSKLKFTDRTAKKRKKYFYKIRAYRINGDRVVYANYSFGMGN